MSGVPPVGNRVNGSKMVHLSLRGRSGSNYHLGRKLEERDGNQYLATEINSQRRVVINILALPNRFDVHEAGRMRNTLEAQYRFMSKVDSPHLLKALDRGVTPEGRPFIVMEYAEGKSLEEFPRGILKAKDGPGIMLQITEGLKNLSEIGLSHGGLTPANILLEEGKVVFLDPVLPVGEASDALTDTQQIAGTKNYMAPFSYYSRAKSPPPQAPARIRIDIYSLGIIFYEFLAGQNPICPAAASARCWIDIQGRSVPISH